MSQDVLRLEFGRYTEWILEAVEAVAVPDLVAVACRGTADRALFEDLADAVTARPGLRVLDVGCGMGGPAAWLRRTRGCEVVGIDLMEQSVRAARMLFGEPLSLVASTYSLPFRDRSFGAVWAVGVLEMIENKAGALREAARVLEPGGRAALYSFTTASTALDDPPASDHFVSAHEVRSIASDAGLGVVRAEPAALARPPDDAWRQARVAVADEVRRRHGADPDFELVKAELDRFGRLRSSGAVTPWRFDLVKPPE